MSDLSCLEKAFLNLLISDDFYPWNPYDEQTEVFLSEQEKKWNFTHDLTDSEIEKRSADLFAQFKNIPPNTNDSEYSQSSLLKPEQMGKEQDNLAV